MTLTDLYALAKENQIIVDSFELHSREALSVMDDDGRCYIAIDPLQLTDYDDERCKLAHELGHCVQGAFYNRYALCDVRQKHENRADKWAINCLVPINEFDAAIADGCDSIWSLAEHFGVTEDFMKKAVCYYVHGNLAVDMYV